MLLPPGLAQPQRGSSELIMEPPAEPSAALLQEDVYILGPGDGLQINFLAVPEFSQMLDILNDGTASLPLLGTVRLEGLTLSQATLWLQSLYTAQLQRPDLQLSVARPRPLRVAIVGEVERPGIYTLTNQANPSLTEAAVTNTGLPTLVDAIQQAGGITLRSDLSGVELQRRMPSQGEQRFKRTRVNLLSLITEGDLRQNPLLFDGDVIRLRRASEAIEPLATELGATTLAPQDITVNVVGEVKSPGAVSVPANTPLMKAILAAGDVSTWRAKTSNIELVRLNRNGTVTRRSYKLDYNLPVSPESNPPLVAGDTIIVNRSRYAVSSDAINAVAQPLSGLVNVLTLFRLLSDD
ncbi:MAG: SLBB domain-containing protein [Synechococcaceae cyanobacterium]